MTRVLIVPSSGSMKKAATECTACESTSRQRQLQDRKRHLVWWNRCDSILVAVTAFFLFMTWLLFIVELRLHRSPRTPKHDRKLTCYYRLEDATLPPSSIPGDRCTHLLLSFATVGSDFRVNVTIFGGPDGIRRRVPALQLDGKRRVMLSVGGGGSGSGNFAMMAKNPELAKMYFYQITYNDHHSPRSLSSRGRAESRQTSLLKYPVVRSFLASCSELFEHTGLDGIDYDWEFPGLSERFVFSRLLEWTRVMLDEVGGRTNRTLEMSVALPGPFVLSVGFSVDSLTRHCDFVNVMTYDLVLLNSIRKRAAFHNALYTQGVLYTPFTVVFSIEFWLILGIPRRMICLGIPTYGVAYQLEDRTVGGLHAEVNGYSPLGSNVAYSEVCELANLSSSKVVWSAHSRVPYLDDGRGNWISFDNVQSVREKVGYAERQGLGGLMIFSLNADDHMGLCGEGELPLTRAASESWT